MLSRSLRVISKKNLTTSAEKQLDTIASFTYELECYAIKVGTLPVLEATIEILDKFTTIAHRLELIKHRKTPEISAKAVRFQYDTDGEGAQLSPNITIKHRGVMPYCGPSFGLTDMTTITDNIFAPEAERVDTTRQGGKAIKRKETGDIPNPAAPDSVGVGLFKAGTPYRDGIFQCPTDTKFDGKIGEGHTHSETLDKIAESIRKLRQTQQAIIADNKADAQWTPVALEGTAAASSSMPTTPNEEAPKDPPDSGRVKRVAVEKAGATVPQQQPVQP